MYHCRVAYMSTVPMINRWDFCSFSLLSLAKIRNLNFKSDHRLKYWMFTFIRKEYACHGMLALNIINEKRECPERHKIHRKSFNGRRCCWKLLPAFRIFTLQIVTSITVRSCRYCNNITTYYCSVQMWFLLRRKLL